MLIVYVRKFNKHQISLFINIHKLWNNIPNLLKKALTNAPQLKLINIQQFKLHNQLGLFQELHETSKGEFDSRIIAYSVLRTHTKTQCNIYKAIRVTIRNNIKNHRA
jgi:hypothetical protein